MGELTSHLSLQQTASTQSLALDTAMADENEYRELPSSVLYELIKLHLFSLMS